MQVSGKRLQQKTCAGAANIDLEVVADTRTRRTRLLCQQIHWAIAHSVVIAISKLRPHVIGRPVSSLLGCQFQPVQGLHTGEQFELHGGTAPMRLLGAESRHCEPQQDGKRSEHLQ